MRKYILLIASASMLCISACSTIRQITPLDQGEQRVGLAVGGPLFTDLGVPIPVPEISLDYAYGVTDDITLGAALHVTPAVFGLCGVGEAFGTVGVLDQAGFIPAVSVGLDTVLLSDFTTSFFVLPEASATASWKLADFISIYAGAAMMVNFYPKTAGLSWDNAPIPGVPMALLPSFPVGVQLNFGPIQLAAETRLLMPFSSNGNLILHYVGMADYGAIGVYLSASFRFGGTK
jgi:hypothetical protein